MNAKVLGRTLPARNLLTYSGKYPLCKHGTTQRMLVLILTAKIF